MAESVWQYMALDSGSRDKMEALGAIPTLVAMLSHSDPSGPVVPSHAPLPGSAAGGVDGLGGGGAWVHAARCVRNLASSPRHRQVTV